MPSLSHHVLGRMVHQSLQRITVRQTHTDVLIVGGGVVGCALARQLTKRVPGLSVGLIEAGNGPNLKQPEHNDPPHPRSYAMSPASLAVLGLPTDPHHTANDTIDPQVRQRLGFYDSMQIWEANQPASLIFDAQSDLLSASHEHKYLGALVEDATLLRHLWPALADKCQIDTGVRIKSVNVHEDSSKVTVLTTGGTRTTHLLVGADGAHSSVRQLLGFGLTRHTYNQTALTATVQLDAPHRGRAWQRFLPDGGILALLPTFSDQHAIVVWSTTSETAAYWKQQHKEQWERQQQLPHPTDTPVDQSSDQVFTTHINTLLHDGPGGLPPLFDSWTRYWNVAPSSPLLQNILYGLDKVVDLAQYGPAVAAQEVGGRPFWPTPTIQPPLASPLYSFPLSTGQVDRYTVGRVALVGDAAHTVGHNCTHATSY